MQEYQSFILPQILWCLSMVQGERLIIVILARPLAPFLFLFVADAMCSYLRDRPSWYLDAHSSARGASRHGVCWWHRDLPRWRISTFKMIVEAMDIFCLACGACINWHSLGELWIHTWLEAVSRAWASGGVKVAEEQQHTAAWISNMTSHSCNFMQASMVNQSSCTISFLLK